MDDLEKNLSQRASKLRIASISLAENMRNGNFRSMSRGQGIEFSDVREYLIGDNVRSIDWNVTARMGRPFIKQYEEDRELNVFFIFDCSLSMHCGSKDNAKIKTAKEIATLLLLSSEQNSGASGAVFFDGEIRFSCPTKSGKENAMMLLSKIDKLDFESASVCGSALANAIKGSVNLLRKRSIVFVISDFRTAGYENDLAFLAQKHDVIAIRITDSIDSELPKIGTMSFFDPETKASLILPTNSSSFAQSWFEANRRRLDSWNDFCVKRGIVPLLISTKEDVVLALSRFFASRKRR